LGHTNLSLGVDCEPEFGIHARSDEIILQLVMRIMYPRVMPLAPGRHEDVFSLVSLHTMSEPHLATIDAPAAPGTEPEGDHRTVMILEDELIIATDLRTRLESMGYTVAGIHTDGEHALQALSREKPELILVDIGLHGHLDGIEAARRVRAERDVPLVFITAYGDDATRMRALEVPASAYLLKPIADDEFRGIVRRLLPGVPRIPAPVVPPPETLPRPAAPPQPASTVAPPSAAAGPSPPLSVVPRVAPSPVPGSAPLVSRRPVRPATPKAAVSAARARARRSLKPQWEYVFNTYLPRHHCALYRDNTLGVQLQVVTRTSGWISRPKSYYFIDGVRGSFPSEGKLVRRLHRIMMRRARARLPILHRLRLLFVS
jgi:CheY-like chemotaxis protein